VTDKATSGRDKPLAIEARAISHSFRAVKAVEAVDLDVGSGAVFGLLGPDGAGKSTLIRMLATVLPPDRGDALVFGESVTTASRKVTPRIGYMSQRFSMYPDLTVSENLEFFATIRAVPPEVRAQRAAQLLERMGLDEFSDRQAQHLSGGMKQKLMLAATLMHEPDLLLLDEPTTGVDPVSRREFWRIIAGLHREGKTVFVATPYMDEAERCTDVAFMEGGRIRQRGAPADVKRLVPGRLFEIETDDPRAALHALAHLSGVSSPHLFGEVVRVLSPEGGPDADRITTELAAEGVHVGDVRTARIDMETVFAYLAEAESQAQTTAAEDAQPAEEGDAP
jgi:ABC-2 type transport system ATP-binding protein